MASYLLFNGWKTLVPFHALILSHKVKQQYRNEHETGKTSLKVDITINSRAYFSNIKLLECLIGHFNLDKRAIFGGGFQ